jgi:excisionase family DNA binding protein
MPDIEEYITTEQAASALGYHTESVRRLIRTGKLPAEKVAGVWLVHRDALRRYKADVAGLSKHDPTRGR